MIFTSFNCLKNQLFKAIALNYEELPGAMKGAEEARVISSCEDFAAKCCILPEKLVPNPA